MGGGSAGTACPSGIIPCDAGMTSNAVFAALQLSAVTVSATVWIGAAVQRSATHQCPPAPDSRFAVCRLTHCLPLPAGSVRVWPCAIAFFHMSPAMLIVARQSFASARRAGVSARAWPWYRRFAATNRPKSGRLAWSGCHLHPRPVILSPTSRRQRSTSPRCWNPIAQ